MAIFSDDVKVQLRNALESLGGHVNILYFTQTLECGICGEAHQFLKEITALSDKLSLSVFDFLADKEQVSYYKIERVPCIALLDGNDEDTRIRFYGIPSGYEINSFLRALHEVSGVRPALTDDNMKRIRQISHPVHIEVFVSMTCPYCPEAVVNAHRLALENPHIRGDMIDAAVFTPLAIKHKVTGVPKTVLNGTIELDGLIPIESLIAAAEKSQTT